MGLYDSITVYSASFPEKHKGVVFQTKDLYSALEEYKVTLKGLLYRKHVVREVMLSKTNILGYKTIDVCSKWLRKTDYIGCLRVYTSLRGSWVEYELDIYKGRLSGWRRIKKKSRGSK